LQGCIILLNQRSRLIIGFMYRFTIRFATWEPAVETKEILKKYHCDHPNMSSKLSSDVLIGLEKKRILLCTNYKCLKCFTRGCFNDIWSSYMSEYRKFFARLICKYHDFRHSRWFYVIILFFFIANVDIDFDVYTFPTRHAMSECSLIIISISYVLG